MRTIQVATLIAGLNWGCSQTTRPEADTELEAANRAHAEAVRDLVLDLNSWPDTSLSVRNELFSNEELAEYELAAIQIQQYTISAQLAGIQLAYDTIDIGHFMLTEQISANLFVLLRIAYSVPQFIPKSAPLVLSPYTVFTERPTGQYPLRWPVEISSTGLLSKISGFIGFKGGPHLLLDEWAWLATTHGPREIPSCASRCGQYSPSEACQCDSRCESHGDCCSDHRWSCTTTSLATPPSSVQTGPQPERNSRWRHR